MNLDELINKAISMASEVGVKKRKQQWLMAREDQDAAMARTQLQETGAMDRTRLTDTGATSRTQLTEAGAMERTKFQDLGQTARQRLAQGFTAGENALTREHDINKLGLTQQNDAMIQESKNRASLSGSVAGSLFGKDSTSSDYIPQKNAILGRAGLPRLSTTLATETPEQKKKRLKEESESDSRGL